MRYMTQRNAELLGAEIVIAIFFPVFLATALYATLGTVGTRESFYAAITAFTSGCISLGAILSYLLAIYHGIGSGPDPGRGIRAPHSTTPCDARG